MLRKMANLQNQVFKTPVVKIKRILKIESP